MTETVIIDDLSFELRRSDQRTTFGVTIERDGGLVLTVPTNSPTELVERFAKEKQFWVYKKLAQKEMLFRPRPPKEFVTGEGFYYLGRSYRLKVVTNGEASHGSRKLHLHQGRFILARAELSHAERLFTEWYTLHAHAWITRKSMLLANRLDLEPPAVVVRDLGFRWGSCGPARNVNFHWRTILLPPRIIEYIVAHEMIHLHVPQHSPRFWLRLQQAMPDYQERKQWLAQNGASY
jgi:predicted metal-dependent hydrolase